MAVYKCKMCGAGLEVTPGASVAECEFCGTTQTVPTAKDENLQGLFNRANTLRLKSEFDKAEQLYEKIVAADETQAEAYWGIVLCRYGIEYVEDPTTFRRVPTCHRTSYDSVIADSDYKSALQYADLSQRSVYEKEAAAIDMVQKDILNIVNTEEPFDVFICYKETDENGNRTVDSTIANDIYYELTKEGLKVFYAAITLEDKLGKEYEPYIFAALNTAKVMLVIGTKPEYFNATWVKNEWSRFLKIIKTDRSKQLFPCYRDMDAYDLPDEFKHMQAQDMSKIGFITDIVRGIKKLTSPADTSAPAPVPFAENNSNTAALLKRAFIFLEDGNWQSADEYCEKVLDLEPENAEAYLAKLLCEYKIKTKEELALSLKVFGNSSNYKKLLRYADNKLRTEAEAACLKSTLGAASEIIRSAAVTTDHSEAIDLYSKAESILLSVSGDDAAKILELCRQKSLERSNDQTYDRAVTLFNSEDESDVDEAEKLFTELGDWKNSREFAQKCPGRKTDIHNASVVRVGKTVLETSSDVKMLEVTAAKVEKIGNWQDAPEVAKALRTRHDKILNDRATAQRLQEEQRQKQIAENKANRRKEVTLKILKVVIPLVLIVSIVLTLRHVLVIVPREQYETAMSLYNEGNYEEALPLFEKLDDHRDSEEMLGNCHYNLGNFEEACTIFRRLSLTDKVNEIVNEHRELAQAGDVVKFGKYEQDNSVDNGMEDIEWVVLTKEDNKLLLFSKYILDYRVFCEKDNDDWKWGSSDIRIWLNTDFYDLSFNDDEKAIIQVNEVVSGWLDKVTTNDNVIMLYENNLSTFKQYLTAEATPYAAAKAPDENADHWWTLSSEFLGNIYCGPNTYQYVNAQDCTGVCPAIWITLE